MILKLVALLSSEAKEFLDLPREAWTLFNDVRVELAKHAKDSEVQVLVNRVDAMVTKIRGILGRD